MALRDTNGDGVADLSRRLGPPGDMTPGLPCTDGHLYYAWTTRMYAVALGGELVPSAAPEIIVADLPESGSGHRTKPITFDGAGYLSLKWAHPRTRAKRTPAHRDRRVRSRARCCEARRRSTALQRDGTQPKTMRVLPSATRRGTATSSRWNGTPPPARSTRSCTGATSWIDSWPAHYSADEDARTPAEEFHRIDEGANLGWPYTYYDAQRRQRMVMPEYGGDGGKAGGCRGTMDGR